MLINTNKFAFSLAIAAGVIWEICTVLVMLLPEFMTTMMAHMMHMDLAKAGLTLTTSGFIVGLVGWMLLAGVFGWFMAKLYNYTVKES